MPHRFFNGSIQNLMFRTQFTRLNLFCCSWPQNSSLSQLRLSVFERTFCAVTRNLCITMASRIPGKTSTILSKTSPKAISKRESGKGLEKDEKDESPSLAGLRQSPQVRDVKSVYGSQVQEKYPQQSTQGSNERSTDSMSSSSRCMIEANRVIEFYDPEEFQEGTIFSTTIHEPHFRQGQIDPTNVNHTQSNFGTVNSKYRKFVVISRLERHVITVPIYTHEGRSLANKPNKHEYVSIRDVEFGNTAASMESYGHNNILHFEGQATGTG